MEKPQIILKSKRPDTKITYDVIPIKRNNLSSKVQKHKVEFCGCQGLVGMRKEWLLNEVSPRVMKSSGMGHGGSCKTLWIYLVAWNCTLQNGKTADFTLYILLHSPPPPSKMLYLHPFPHLLYRTKCLCRVFPYSLLT